MHIVITLAFLTLFANSVLAAEPFDFKGAPLGASEKELVEKVAPNNGKLTCRDASKVERPFADRKCIANEINQLEFAGTTITVEFGKSSNYLSFQFIEDRLMSVSLVLDEFEFNKMVAALTKRYGKPQVTEKRPFRIRPGAPFESDYFEWRKGGSILRAWQYSDSLRKSGFEYMLDSYPALFLQRRKDLTK